MKDWILSSSVLILIIAALRFALRDRLSLRLQYGLWLLVLLRLLLPFSIGHSAASVANVVSQSSNVYENTHFPLPAAAPEDAPALDPSTVAGGQHSIETELDAPEAPSVTAAFDPRSLLLPLWLTGAGVVMAVAVISNLVFLLRLRRGRHEAQINCALPVYSFDGIDSPCLAGLFQPAIYLPPQLIHDSAALEHVLEHECAHFRHGDHIWARLRCLCLALHWYNPLVWLAAVLSKRDGELACDEAAVARLGEAERFDYARTLICLTCPGHAGLLSAATTMTGSRRSISERVKLLAKRPRMAVLTLITVLILALAAAGCTFTGSADKETPLPSPPAESESAVTPTTTSEPSPAPVRYVDSFTEDDGKLVLKIDLEKPDFTAQSMAETELTIHEFTPEEAQNAASLIFCDAQLYDTSTYNPSRDYSKEDLDRYLDILKILRDDQELLAKFSRDIEMSNEQIDGCIGRYGTTAYRDGMAANSELEPVRWSYSNDLNRQSGSWIRAKTYVDGEIYRFTVRDDHQESGILHGIYAGVDLGYLATVPHEYYNYTHGFDAEPTAQQMDAARLDAQRIVDGLTDGSWQIGCCTPVELPGGRYKIQVEAYPTYNGYGVCRLSTERFNDTYQTEYMRFQYVADGTLSYFCYLSPWDQTGVWGEAQRVISADEALDIASELLKSSKSTDFVTILAEDDVKTDIRATVDVDSMYLGYAMDFIDGEYDRCHLIPAICFGGECTISDDDDSGLIWKSASGNPILILSATDGSVIRLGQ